MPSIQAQAQAAAAAAKKGETASPAVHNSKQKNRLPHNMRHRADAAAARILKRGVVSQKAAEKEGPKNMWLVVVMAVIVIGGAIVQVLQNSGKSVVGGQ